jgi:sigma-E factor negative regulatory protein RseA
MEFSAEGGAHALRRQQLSALMDGDLAPPAVVPLVAAWRDEADLQASWQLYSLVGDVLRSEELARSPQADTQFLSALRTRLQAAAQVRRWPRPGWRGM